ncbi:hypothetical protein EB796_011194 [Bugula neritina]|uniref:Uncharacterized protein n=1 Tax=Bugula neritina TaxID=10212 RepID=A0A7J7JYT7_BUGNE|nr:hypothetical protein EB796_011194 [Bugula neritina]
MDILSRVDIDINKSVEVLNSNQSILTVEFLSPTNANNFYYIGCECKTVENTSRTIGEFRSFKVSYKPPPVSGFQCIVKDFENAVCTWDLQTDYGSEYTVCFGLINDWMRKKIKESYVPPDKTSCGWRRCAVFQCDIMGEGICKIDGYALNDIVKEVEYYAVQANNDYGHSQAKLTNGSGIALQ